MFTHRFVVSACAVAVVALLGAASTQALGRLNHLTFSGEVALPGVVLTPGAYTFEAGPHGTASNIARVTTRDGRRVLYTGFTTQLSRREISSTPVVSFGEAPAGQSMPISVWWPAHSAIGYQFRY